MKLVPCHHQQICFIIEGFQISLKWLAKGKIIECDFELVAGFHQDLVDGSKITSFIISHV